MNFKIRILIPSFLALVLSQWHQDISAMQRDPITCLAWAFMQTNYCSPTRALWFGYTTMKSYLMAKNILDSTAKKINLYQSITNKEHDISDYQKLYKTLDSNKKLSNDFLRLKKIIDATQYDLLAEQKFLCKVLLPSYVFMAVNVFGSRMFDYSMEKLGSKMRSLTPLIEVNEVPLLTPFDLIDITTNIVHYIHWAYSIKRNPELLTVITFSAARQLPHEIAIHMTSRILYSYVKPHVDRHINAKQNLLLNKITNLVCQEGLRFVVRLIWSKTINAVGQLNHASPPAKH